MAVTSYNGLNMTKTRIMLVEDDKSLREIYGVRLFAEGYDIISAGDGEEALAMAIKERPQLIISDVMMPKISGFDMLDILRSTTETKNIKVIMMTALSSEEQRARGESLGADRYLVKSQVGIEDVVRVVHEVLEDKPGGAVPSNPPTADAQAPRPAQATPAPPRPATAPAVPVRPAPAPAPPPAPTSVVTPPHPEPRDTQNPKPSSSIKTRVIQPISDPNNPPVNMSELLDRELAKEAGLSEDEVPTIQTAEQERQALEQELENFQTGASTSPDEGTTPPPPPPPPGAPTS